MKDRICHIDQLLYIGMNWMLIDFRLSLVVVAEMRNCYYLDTVGIGSYFHSFPRYSLCYSYCNLSNPTTLDFQIGLVC